MAPGEAPWVPGTGRKAEGRVRVDRRTNRNAFGGGTTPIGPIPVENVATLAVSGPGPGWPFAPALPFRVAVEWWTTAGFLGPSKKSTARLGFAPVPRRTFRETSRAVASSRTTRARFLDGSVGRLSANASRAVVRRFVTSEKPRASRIGPKFGGKAMARLDGLDVGDTAATTRTCRKDVLLRRTQRGTKRVRAAWVSFRS